jgi:hypothetical protein
MLLIQGGKGETPVLRSTGGVRVEYSRVQRSTAEYSGVQRSTSGVQAEYSGVQAEYVKYGGVPESRLFPLVLISSLGSHNLLRICMNFVFEIIKAYSFFLSNKKAVSIIPVRIKCETRNSCCSFN